MPRQSAAIFFSFLLLFPFPAIAQIIPDNSLGPESSRTVPDTINNLPSDRITGGAIRGVNLFHSLREFSIPEGRGAYFENPSGIANIFTRVTGGNPSNILGNLGVLGNSNLFLINPKGIVFGPNAQLDLRGSFVGSSASGVVFNNGFEFSSANPQTVPLLAINIPVGLRFRDTPGAIVN
ncbi:MAG: filamentous hemagglutinin N-terminal domain-containing protein, partial [Microcoleus sp. T3-bin5]|nr:filamentous hemagglutinin N-terminal domain-containing protein [Microcoleus sp. T3-bin5]